MSESRREIIGEVIARLEFIAGAEHKVLEGLLLKAGYKVKCTGKGEWEACDLVLDQDEVCPDCEKVPPQLPSRFPEEWHMRGQYIDWDQAAKLHRERPVSAQSVLTDKTEWLLLLISMFDEPGADAILAMDTDNDCAWILHQGFGGRDVWTVFQSTVESMAVKGR